MARALRPGRGCSPQAGSVVVGAVAGATALSASGAGLTPTGFGFLLGGYALGALAGHLAVLLLGRAFGEWWRR
ncbi:MAG TPA: hypothetical protein VG370_29005 [Chloroflexota bacterium]|jgi:hypothetical protein|nr:hypothetical protein [Chloroflexota bacterium]